jgi:hypothetical protein
MGSGSEKRSYIVQPTEGMTAVGVFADRSQAEQAVEELHRNGFAAEQIGFLTPDAPSGIETPSLPPGTKAEEGAAAGAAVGAAFGGLLGAALATAFIPGVGPVLAGGLLAGAIGGTLTGLAGGSILGALIGLRIPEEQARHYEREFHSGRTLVTVRAGGRYEEAVTILRRAEEARATQGHSHSRSSLSRLADEGDSAPGSGSVFVPPP